VISERTDVMIFCEAARNWILVQKDVRGGKEAGRRVGSATSDAALVSGAALTFGEPLRLTPRRRL
jgi:hypothetical protein